MAYIPSECSLEEYERVIYSGDAKNRLYVKHGDTVIGTNGDNNASPFASKLTIKRRILKNGSKTITLNNFISQEIDLVLHDYKIENLKEEIEIKIGTFIDSVGDYVYVPIGKFLIQDNPTTDKNKTTYKLRDFSVKFDFYYNAKPLIDANGGKVTKLQILHDICEQAGVVCNIKSFPNYDDEIGIYDNSITARTYITYIAEQAGKMASINRYGELVFVDINSDSNTVDGDTEIILENAVERNISSFVIEGNSKQETSVQGKNYYTGNKLTNGNNWGVDYTFDNSIIKLNGTTVSQGIVYEGSTKVKVPTGTYNFSVRMKSGNFTLNGNDFAIYLMNGSDFIVSGNFNASGRVLSYINQENPSTNIPIMTVNNSELGIRLYSSSSGIVFENLELEIQLEPGNTMTDFEQFIPNTPSIEYPSEIKTVKGIENLFNKNDYEQGWLRYSDNVLVDPTQTTFYSTGYIEVKGNTNHIIDFYNQTSLNSGGIMQYDENKNWLGDGIAETEQVMRFKTKPSTKYVRFVFRIDAIDNIRFMEGTTLFPYVPNGSNYLVNKITGKQLFNKNGNLKAFNGVWGLSLSNFINENLLGKTITLSINFVTHNIQIAAQENKEILLIAHDTNKLTFVVTQEMLDIADKKHLFFHNADSSGWINTYPEQLKCDIQVELGTERSEYEEYKETIVTYNLQDNELVAVNGVKDEIDIVNGVLTKRIGKLVLDGVENKFIGRHGDIYTDTNSFFMLALPNKLKTNGNGEIDNAICSHLTYINHYDAREAIKTTGLWWEGYNIYNYASLPFLTNEEANQWLIDEYNNGTPVTIYYKLDNPETIQLDKTEIKTFEGFNFSTLLSDVDAHITIEYDVKKYVHNISPDIVEKFTVGDTYKVSKVLFEAGVNKFEYGTDDNDTLYLNSDNPYINDQFQITKIYPNLKGFEINSFKTGKILGNPTIDPADLIKIEYNDIIYKTLAQYTLNFSGTMTSTYETTVEHEAKQSNVSNSGMASLKKYVKTELDNVEGKFSLQVGELNDNLDNSIDNVNDRISETDGKLNDTNTNLTSVIGRVTTLEQDSKGWTFEFETIQKSLETLDGKVTENDTATKEIKDYIKFVDGDIILGSSDSENSLVISKAEIAFMTGNNKSAYITNNELYITDNTVLNKQTVGKWETKPDSEGNLNTRWIG